MTPTPQQPTKRDVFIVFSKSEPLEARFALAVKDGLEQIGRFAHEYEDWSWVDQATASESQAAGVDHAVLRAMFQACSAVLVIPPRHDKPSDGVAVELDMLAQLGLPVVLLRWHLMTEDAEPRDLNVIHRYQVHGANPSEKWISDASERIAELLWFACSVAELRNKHAPIGNAVLDALPAFGSTPLTAFKLRDGLVSEDDFLREPDPAALAGLATAETTRATLSSVIEDWWLEAEPVLRYMRKSGYPPIQRPCRILHDAMYRVAQRARDRFPDLQPYSTDAVIRRGRMLVRFHENDDAVRLLSDEIERADHDADLVDSLYATRALAHDAREDVSSAVADMDAAMKLAPGKEHELTHRFDRAIFRARGGEPEAHRAAIDDYTHILEFCSDAYLRLSALNHRALHHAKLGELPAAFADWTAVIEKQAKHPRAAAQARFNRAAQYEELGKLADTRDDYASVLAWADTSGMQRFRALEDRAHVLEQLGALASAADDIEAMLAMDVADPQSRLALKSKLHELRSAAR